MIRRAIGVSLLLLLAVPAVYMQVATPPASDVRLSAVPEGSRYRVYLAEGSYHTAIVVEQPPGWWLGPAGGEDAPFVEYAWGDRSYYMESDFRPHAVFATLFLPTESVVYVQGRSGPPEAANWKRVFGREVSAQEMGALLETLEAAFVRTGEGERAAPFQKVPEYAGRFYPGRGFYIFWSNCNTWTVERLRRAGLARTSAAVVLSGQVAGRLEGFDAKSGSTVPD